MRKAFLPIFLVIVLSLSTIPVFSFADDTVAPYTTTSYGPEYPWWSIYHLTSPTAAANSVKGGEGGQMIHSMAVSSDGLKLYYGLDTGGIYTSDDGGANWRLSEDGFNVYGSNDIVIDPDNKDIAFSTGFLCADNLTNGNTGVYRTTDGGAHWSLVKNTDYYYKTTNKVLKFGAVNGQGFRTIYAGTHTKGIFKSEDGGDTWTNIGCVGDRIEDLYVDPSNAIPSVIAEVSEQSGVVASTDGGTTWTPKNSGLPSTDVLSLAVDPAEPSIWFVAVNGDKKLYKSTDSGTTWSAAGDMTSVLQNGQPTKLNFSAYDGTHTPILYIAVAGNENCFRYSPDLGESFYTPDYDQTNALRNQTGYWPEAMAASPVDPWTVWAGIDGVIYKSSYNSGTGHLVLTPSCSGSSGMRVYDMAFDNAGNILYTGVMDHGIYKAASGSGTDYPPVTHLSNVQRYNGLWSCLGLTVDPNDPNHIFAKVGDWGSNLIVEESKDGGATWNQIAGTNGSFGEVEYNNKNDQVIYAAGYRSDDNGHTWKKLSMIISAISPVDNNVVYAVSGGTKIYQSADMGDTWSKVASVPDNIIHLTADELKSDRVWTGTQNNGMYRVDGKNVTHIGPDKLTSSVNGGNAIFKVVQDPNNPFHYLAGGADNIAHGPGAGLFESWDGGNTWEQIPGMPGIKDIWTLVINPVKPLVYVSTSNGIVVYDWSKRNLSFPEITPVKVDKYSENFNDDKAQGWTLSGIVTGSAILSSSDSGNNTAVYDWQVAAAPYEYKVDVSTEDTGDSNRMKVIFNYQDEGNYDYLEFGSSSTPVISLNEVVDGSVTDSVQSDAIYNFGGDATTLDLKYSFDGKVTVDVERGGSTTNLFTDIPFATFKASAGKIGVGTDNCAGGSFDNISLMDISATDASVPHEITSYTEDFNDGHANNWTLSQGFAVDQNGVLASTDTSVPQKAIYTPGIATTPYEYKLDLYTSDTDDSNKMIVYFNYSDSSNYDYLEFGAGSPTTVTLNKVAASVQSTIATADTAVDFHGPDWTTLDIKCGNDGLFNIDAIQDGQTTHLFTNASSDDGVQFGGYVSLSDGEIGVGTTTGASIKVDNIQVLSLADTGNISYYSEDFNDNTAQGWVCTDNVNVDLKCVHIDDFNNDSMAIYDRQNVDGPYEYKARFYMPSDYPVRTENFFFGYRDEDNYYYLAIGEGSPSDIKVHGVVDGDDQIMATSAATVTYGGQCTVGDEPIVDIKCDVNGTFTIGVIQNGATTNLFSDLSLPEAAFGKVGLGTTIAASLYFDSVTVTGTVYATPEITAAIHAIRVLPAAANLTLGDQQAVADARTLADSALSDGTAADITNLGKLLACEAKIQLLKVTAPTPTPAPKTTATTTTTTAAIPENGLIKATPEVNGDTAKVAVKREALDKAFDQVKEDENGVRTVQIDVKAVEGINNYDLELSKEIFGAGESGGKRIEIKTPAATMIIPDNMFQTADLANAGNIGISIGQADVSALGRDIKDILGNKPVIELHATVDGKKISWNNKEAPVTVRIDYKPTEEELKNPEHITVWYIDGEGKVQSVPSGSYDPSTGRVTFQTTHFSKYAVAYVEKTFTDLSGYAWAKDEVEVLAAKGISKGTSQTTYSPGTAITRAEFTVMLVKALGLSAELDSNFSDVSTKDYFYEAVGTAKKLGIINGTGYNKFSPNGLMTRQDMAVMVRKALKAANKSMEKGSADAFAKYTDASAIAGYAKDSLADLIKNGILKGNTMNQINPAGNLSRAEAAVVIYAVYSK